MAYSKPGSRFQEDNYHVTSITETRVEILSTEDFYNNNGLDPSPEDWKIARELAARYGMEITEAYGDWQGWSEYTPDPGNVAVFLWRKE